MRLSQHLQYFSQRAKQNQRIQGLTAASLKHHFALTPLFAIMGAGMIFVAAFCTRSLTMHPDVNWAKTRTPQDAIDGKQFKAMNPSGTDYSTLKIPQYRD